MKKHPKNHPVADTQSPLFLVGAERSGTTLLRLMLDHHPRLAFHSEFEFAVDYFNDGRFPAIEEFIDAVQTDRIFHASGLLIDTRLSYPELMNSFLEQYRRRQDKPLVGATVHRHFDRLLKLWPNARFIHLVRDPRDVARSCVAMNWAGNPWAGVERWIEVEHLWDSIQPSITPGNRIDIHYEELVAHPVETSRRICEFIGVEFDQQMFSYTRHTRYGLPDARMAGQWREKMSPRDVQRVESRVGSLLQQRGYTSAGGSLNHPSHLHRKYLAIESALIVKTRRVGLYGLPLVTASWLANRLGIRHWQKQVQRRRNEIDARLLK